MLILGLIHPFPFDIFIEFAKCSLVKSEETVEEDNLT